MFTGTLLAQMAASDVSLDATQIHYVRLYSAAELQMFHCERVHKMPLSGLDPSNAHWISMQDRGRLNRSPMLCGRGTQSR